MQLSDIRTEVLNKGFDPVLFGSSRINQFINDGYLLICRRVDYYINATAQTFATTAGQTNLTLPANWARTRSLLDTDLERELMAVSLRDIDRAVVTTGTPSTYAQDGSTIRIWPTADGVHNLELRYWLLPTALSADTDVPTLPASWHHLLWRYATAECYKSEDDFATGMQWENDFEMKLKMFEADQRFTNTDFGTSVKSMWGDDVLGSDGWHRWPEGF